MTRTAARTAALAIALASGMAVQAQSTEPIKLALEPFSGNPFQEYQVPEAIIKLKQGFGRLIRTRNDSGRVVILDPRILTKYYGRLFLQSLPDCRREIDDGQSIEVMAEN